jgi:hypothetical protein
MYGTLLLGNTVVMLVIFIGAVGALAVAKRIINN